MASKQVKKEGLNQKSSQDFQQQLETHQLTSEVAFMLADEIVDFLSVELNYFQDIKLVWVVLM